MKLERLTHRVSFRTGIILFGAVTCLAISANFVRAGLLVLAKTAVGAGSKAAVTAENEDTALRPSRVTIPEQDLVELRRRIAATRWPSRELVEDRLQGVQLEPAELGGESGHIARAWGTLMERPGYTRYVAQGGDIGASVTDAMGRQAAKGLVGIHLSLLAGALGIADNLPPATEQERTAHNALATFRTSG